MNSTASIAITHPVAAIDQADLADSTKTQYRRALARYHRETGADISGQGILNIISKRGGMIGKPDLQPHDLRRTYAQLVTRQASPSRRSASCWAIPAWPRPSGISTSTWTWKSQYRT